MLDHGQIKIKTARMKQKLTKAKATTQKRIENYLIIYITRVTKYYEG